MIDARLQHSNPINQVSKDADMVSMKRLKRFVSDLISEHAKSTTYGYSVSVHDFSAAEKKLFLLEMVGVDEFEFYAENPTRLAEAIKDHESGMEYWIDYFMDEYVSAKKEYYQERESC